MDGHQVTELLTWENVKPTWDMSSDTLESIVHQATSGPNNHGSEQSLPHHYDPFAPANTSSTLSFSFGKSVDNPESKYIKSEIAKKRTRLEPGRCGWKLESHFQEERGNGSAGGGGAAPPPRENDVSTAMMTWTSLEEGNRSLRIKTTDEDLACHDLENIDQEERLRTKGETTRPNSTRRSRAANHNQSERRRRDKINQKMQALQRLVPNASKNDKVSMLDEVISYLKQLQEQVEMMNTRSLPQMMMPGLGIQQQMAQMYLLASMGMGVGPVIGPTGHTATQSLSQVINPTHIASASTSPFFSPPFVMPPLIPSNSPNATAINNSPPFDNPYSSFFAQSMNMNLYNNMAATMFKGDNN